MPNVSYCEDNNEVHYNPIVIAQPLIVTYNVKDDSKLTNLFCAGGDSETGEATIINASDIYSKIEIDGTEIDMSDLDLTETDFETGAKMYFYGYQLSEGIHNVAYTIKQQELIIFSLCNNITNVIIPDNVTSIESTAFSACGDLTGVTIGSGITSIGGYAFSFSINLTSVTIKAEIPPSLGNGAFGDAAILYVPSTSVDTYKTASGWSQYASRIQAIPNS